MTLAVAAGMLVSCQKKTEEKTELKEPEVVVEEAGIELPNKSDIAFEEAFQKFKSKDYKATSEKIKEAIGFMKTEGDSLKGEPKEQLQKSITALNKIDDILMKKPGIESEQSILAAFDEAETCLAHEYFFLADTYVVVHPAKSKVYLKNGMMHLRNKDANRAGEEKK